MKKLVSARRSINCMTPAASSGGNASSSRNAVTNWAQTKNGSRKKVNPFARNWIVVTMKFTDPSSEEVISSTMPSSQPVCPTEATTDSGAYEVQPELAAPPLAWI